MAIQLIDLGREVKYIDIKADKVPYSFSVKLEDQTYFLTIKYNFMGEFYTIDLRASNGSILAYGEPIRYGKALFDGIEDERFPLPVIVPACLTGDTIDAVTEDNLGISVRFYLHERRVAEYHSG